MSHYNRHASRVAVSPRAGNQSQTKSSRWGIVLCLIVGLSTGGCASGSWNRWASRKTDEPGPRLTLAWAKMKESEGRLTEAREGYEKVLAQEPKNIDAVLGMARLNVKAQRLVEAGQGFDQALELNPKSPVVLREVGSFYSEQQRWDKAIPLLQQAQRLEPHEKSHHFNLAVALTKADRVDEALPHFTEAVGAAAAHYNVGRLLVEVGQTAAAEQQFNLALAKDPQLTDAQFFLDEIRANGKPEAPIIAQPQRQSPVAQQVSGAIPADTRPTINPAFNQRRQTRPPEYPHQGYEELPPPAEMQDEATTSRAENRVTPVGYTPAASAPVNKIRR